VVSGTLPWLGDLSSSPNVLLRFIARAIVLEVGLPDMPLCCLTAGAAQLSQQNGAEMSLQLEEQWVCEISFAMGLILAVASTALTHRGTSRSWMPFSTVQ
jgi:hypothetical protein